jgi:hypothetical protein
MIPSDTAFTLTPGNEMPIKWDSRINPSQVLVEIFIRSYLLKKANGDLMNGRLPNPSPPAHSPDDLRPSRLAYRFPGGCSPRQSRGFYILYDGWKVGSRSSGSECDIDRAWLHGRG